MARVDLASGFELSAKKDQDISEIREAALQVEVELLAAVDKSGDEPNNAGDDEIERLNAKVRVELDANQGGFEIPSYVRLVDPASHRVWIGLGDDDGVRPATVFRVRGRHHSATRAGKTDAGRDGAKVKCTIQVTRVLERHLSEARILEEDVDNPIRKRDSIDLDGRGRK